MHALAALWTASLLIIAVAFALSACATPCRLDHPTCTIN